MLRDFLNWWFGELAGLLPQRMRPAAPAEADATVISPIGDAMDEVAVGLRRGGKETPVGRFALGAPELAELPEWPNKPPVLRLGEVEVLVKTVTLPLAAERDLDQALLFEMDRETPFRPEELYWNHRIETADRQNGRLLVRLVLVPRQRLEHLLERLAQARVRPVRAEIADGPDAGFWLPLDGDRHPLGRRRRPFVKLLAACCAALALAALATPFVRQSIVISKLDSALAAGRAAAAESDRLRSDVQRSAGAADLVVKARDKVGHPLAVLAAVTQVLPDDSYLTELQLQQRKLTISGRSAAAARLIGAMAADSAFHNPTFAAPVTRIEALRQEIFTIVTEVMP
jgi:general secretion pathway protein L